MKIKKITEEQMQKMFESSRDIWDGDPDVQRVTFNGKVRKLYKTKLNQIIDWINKQEEKE